MRLFLFMLFGLSVPLSAAEIPGGTYTFSEIKCGSGESLPIYPLDSKISLTLNASSKTFALKVDFLGAVGGDCKGQTVGAYAYAKNELTLTQGLTHATGSFTSPCRELVSVLSGRFKLQNGATLKLTGLDPNPVCERATITAVRQ